MRVAVAAGLLAAAALAAQETPTFRTETSLALVRFHATKGGRYLDDLKPDDLILFEDGQPRPFALFEGGRTARRSVPVDVSLLFDTRGSVLDIGLLDAAAFKSVLLDGLPSVRVAVYGFAAKLRRFSPPSRDYDALREALDRIGERRPGRAVNVPIELPPKRKSDPRGGTWIYEAVIGAARDAAAQAGNATRMIVVFSDGFATTNSTPEDAASVCEELGITVYPVVLGHWKLGEKIRAQNEREANRRPGSIPSAATDRLNEQESEIQQFAGLGRLTGGGAFDPPAMGPGVLRQIVAGLAARVQTEYVLGFTPESSGTPRRHKLEVRLRDKSLGQIVGGKRQVVH